MAEKCEVVNTNAFLTVTSGSLTARAACSQKMHTGTSHNYVTALELKSEYYLILTWRDAICMPSDYLVWVSAHVKVCPAL